jgi:1,4-alpha-glucan branching enzyme
MSIEKKYLTGNKFCKVTFILPSDLAKTANTANVVGDFNNWDPQGLPMKKYKNGKFSVATKLLSNKEYQFRYLVDGNNWHTDLDADDVMPAPFAYQQNSVVKV